MKASTAHEDLAVVIMAGGMGTRFWPASRESIPKQFLPICGPRSLLEECFLRIASMTDSAKIFVIINARHRSLTNKVLGNKGVQIVEEPCGRNTAPCIGLGCIHVMKRFGDLPIVALPADHSVSGEAEFRRCLERGISLLKDGGIVTVGITPTHPETGYGYIEMGPRFGNGEAFAVNRFVEKPDSEEAKRLLASQNYLWNSGIFLFRPSTMLREIDIHLPVTRKRLNQILEAIDTDQYPSVLEKAYREMESISVDYGIMEKTEEPIYVIRGDFGWSDVGHWAAVRKLREAEKDGDGNIVSGTSLLLDTKNTFIHSQGNRLIAVLGLDDLLIVDTKDVLLIADVKRSQEVRRFPQRVKDKGWSEFT